MRMPWKNVVAADERIRFVKLVRESNRSVVQLVEAFGISRKTAYKWLDRYDEEGADGLRDRPRLPLSRPNATGAAVIKRLLALKKKYPHWGPRKLVSLMSEHGSSAVPSASTAGAILKRHGLVKARTRRQRLEPPVSHVVPAKKANEVWCADFKGEFKLLNGQYCWPLTVTDAASRYVLCCVALNAIRAEKVREIFERLFKKFGLPETIHTDNGVPFASGGLWGLTLVSGRWLEHGVMPRRSRPGKPQDNGAHERFHRTLKEATALPPQRDMRSQQKAFDRFCREYNEQRPHEALGMKTPASLYTASTRRFRKLPAAPTYPQHFYVARSNKQGHLHINGKRFFVGRWASRVELGLEELLLDRFRVHFGRYALGEVDMQTELVAPYGWNVPISPTRSTTLETFHKLHSVPQA